MAKRKDLDIGTLAPGNLFLLTLPRQSDKNFGEQIGEGFIDSDAAIALALIIDPHAKESIPQEYEEIFGGGMTNVIKAEVLSATKKSQYIPGRRYSFVPQYVGAQAFDPKYLEERGLETYNPSGPNGNPRHTRLRRIAGRQ